MEAMELSMGGVGMGVGAKLQQDASKSVEAMQRKNKALEEGTLLTVTLSPSPRPRSSPCAVCAPSYHSLRSFCCCVSLRAWLVVAVPRVLRCV